MRDPWLPPVISSWSTAPRGLGWMRKNSSRTGSPVTSVRPLGKKAAVSGKETSARATRREMERLVNPGTAFGSITTTGTRRRMRGQHRRSGDVAAHAEDGGGAADTAVATDRGDGQAAERGDRLAQADAVESADLDLLQVEPRGRHQLGFHAVLGADKGDVVAAGAQFASHGEPRDYVPASAAAGHQKITLLHFRSRLG